MFDLLEKKILNWGIPIFFLLFIFLPYPISFQFLYFSTFIFFLILFGLCTYWANEYYPGKKFLIGFLVSFLHSFLFFLGGVLGLIFASIFLKVSPPIFNFFQKSLKF